MERIIKIREYIAFYSMIFILWLILYFKIDVFTNWIHRVSPFKIIITDTIALYCIVAILFILASIEPIIEHIRVKNEYLEKYTLYNALVIIMTSILLILPHIIFLHSIIYKNYFNQVWALLTGFTAIPIKLLLKRLYIGELFFICSGKKYYFSRINKVIDDELAMLKFIIDDKEHSLNCGSKRVKNIILDKLKEKIIDIDEKQSS